MLIEFGLGRLDSGIEIVVIKGRIEDIVASLFQETGLHSAGDTFPAVEKQDLHLGILSSVRARGQEQPWFCEGRRGLVSCCVEGSRWSSDGPEKTPGNCTSFPRWCSDLAGPYPSDEESGILTNPIGPSLGAKRIMRGSCLYYTATPLSATERYYTLPAMKRSYCGFRVARDVD